MGCPEGTTASPRVSRNPGDRNLVLCEETPRLAWSEIRAGHSNRRCRAVVVSRPLDAPPLYTLHHSFNLVTAPQKPVRGPDAEKAPSERFELLLSQPVAVPGRGCGMIRRAIAFDGQHVAPWLLGMHCHQIDAVARAADLAHHFQPSPGQLVEDGLLELVERHRRHGAASNRLPPEAAYSRYPRSSRTPTFG